MLYWDALARCHAPTCSCPSPAQLGVTVEQLLGDAPKCRCLPAAGCVSSSNAPPSSRAGSRKNSILGRAVRRCAKTRARGEGGLSRDASSPAAYSERTQVFALAAKTKRFVSLVELSTARQWVYAFTSVDKAKAFVRIMRQVPGFPELERVLPCTLGEWFAWQPKKNLPDLAIHPDPKTIAHYPLALAADAGKIRHPVPHPAPAHRHRPSRERHATPQPLPGRTSCPAPAASPRVCRTISAAFPRAFPQPSGRRSSAGRSCDRSGFRAGFQRKMPETSLSDLAAVSRAGCPRALPWAVTGDSGAAVPGVPVRACSAIFGGCPGRFGLVRLAARCHRPREQTLNAVRVRSALSGVLASRLRHIAS